MPHSPPILTLGDPSAFTRGKKGGRHGPEEQKRNHGKVRDGFVCEETSRYDSHGVPKPRQTAQSRITPSVRLPRSSKRENGRSSWKVRSRKRSVPRSSSKARRSGWLSRSPQS